MLAKKYQVTANQVLLVNQDIWNEELGAAVIALENNSATEKVISPLVVYIPWWINMDLLTGTRSPHTASGISWERSKKWQISEAYTPLCDWYQIRFPKDYVGDLDGHLYNLPPIPKIAGLINLRRYHFRTVLTHAFVPPPPYIPDTIPFMLNNIPNHPLTKLLPPPSPA